jgi:putative membrane protein
MMPGGLGMLLFWGLIIALIVLALRGLAGKDTRSEPSAGFTGVPQHTPLEIAQARYARGEISREEYETIRRDLQAA